MNIYLRLLRVLLILPFTRRRELAAESRLAFRVWLNDCDFNLHMNNGRYLTFMDLGRVHLLAQLGFLRGVVKRRWSPVLSAAEINFIRPLAPFAKFTLHTRLLTWDDKYFYIEQRFERAGMLCAHATVRGLFVERGRSLPTRDILRAFDIDPTPPEMPPTVSHWKALTALKKQHAPTRHRR